MRPLSELVPKPALPLPEGPVIGWPIGLAAPGAGRIVVNTWHLADRMETAARALDIGQVELVFSREDELMGTAGGLALARDRGLLGSRGPVLVLNGDVVLDLSLEPLCERHEAGDDLVTMALLPHPDPSRWSRVTLDADGLVTTIAPPAPAGGAEIPLLYPGVMIVSRAALDAIPSGPGGTSESLWDPALEQHRLGGVVLSGRWKEVGTPADYLAAVLQQLQGRSLVHRSARIDPAAGLEEAMVGEGCSVGAGAIVIQSVLGEGAAIGPGARVTSSVLMGKVEIAPGEVVTDEFIAIPRY
jgi:mannose-1-phosphate guanylyltransferase